MFIYAKWLYWFFYCLQCTSYRTMQWCSVTMAGFLCSLMQALYCLTIHGVVMHCNLYLIHVRLGLIIPCFDCLSLVINFGHSASFYHLCLDYCNQKRKVTLSHQCLWFPEVRGTKMTCPGAKSEFLTEGALPQSLRGALVVPRLGT